MPFLLILLAQLATAEPAAQPAPEAVPVEQVAPQSAEPAEAAEQTRSFTPEVRCERRAVTGQRLRQLVCQRVDAEFQSQVAQGVRDIGAGRGGSVCDPSLVGQC